MLVGQSCRWWLPGALLWPRNQRSRLRQNHFGQADRSSRGLQEGHEHPREDNAAVDHDRPQTGLRDCGSHGGGDGINQRRDTSLKGTSDISNNAQTIRFRPGPLSFRWFDKLAGTPNFKSVLAVGALALLFCIPLKDSRPNAVQAQYDRALQLFRRGYLEKSQQESEAGYKQYKISNPAVAEQFQLLAAESMLFRGMYPDALRVLASYHPPSSDPQGVLHKLAIEAVALTRQQQLGSAHSSLALADAICGKADYPACGDILRAHGILAGQEGRRSEARQFFLDTVEFSNAHHDPWLEASASINLGWAALQDGHFDEALDWSKTAEHKARELGAEDFAQVAAGNVGWAY